MQARTIKKLSLTLPLIAVSIVIFLLNSSSQVNAQQPSTSLAISPPTYELSANPGDTITNTMRVDNLTDQSLEISVSPRNFTALGEEGQVNLTEEDSTYSLAKWITVSPDSAAIGPKESRTFEYTISIPGNAEPGGRFGSIVFKTSARPVEGQTGVAIGQEIGSLVFLKIAGKVIEKTTISNFTAVHGLNEYKPVDFDIRVKNDGNVHVRPTGTVTITNMFGKKVATVPITSRNILPDATRKIEAQWRDDGRLIFGRYTATASIVYGVDSQIITASTTFWGLPYTFILVGLGVLTVLAIILFRGRKRIRLALRALSGKI